MQMQMPVLVICEMKQSCPRVGLGRVGSRFFSFGGFGWVGSTIAKVRIFLKIMLMHLKHGKIRFGCTKH